MHVITGLGIGGAERSLEKVARGLAGRYRQAVVSLLGMGPVGERIAAFGVPVHTLGMGRGLPGATPLFRLVRLLDALRPDLIQGWMHHGNLAAWAATKLLRWEGPMAWTIREMPRPLGGEKVVARAVLMLAAAVSQEVPVMLYNSRASAVGHGAIGFRPARTVVIPNGFDTDRFRPRPEARLELRQALGLPADACLIGLAARYHEIKDHGTFLRAARRIREEHPTARFVLVGSEVDSSNQQLTSLVTALSLGDRVHLLGRRTDIEAVMPAFDVACLTSRAEGFPNVVGEAMACGVPCVVTDVGDAALLVGATGRVVPPADPEAFARGVGSLLGLPEGERWRLGRDARGRILAHFTLAKMIARYDQLYEEMLDVWNRGVRSHSKRG